MLLFQVSDLSVESSIPFPELRPSNGRTADLTFRVQPAGTAAPHSGEWVQRWILPSGKPWLSCANLGGDCLLRFSELADFLVSENGKEISCFAGSETPMETIRHLFLDQVIPLVLSHWGRLVLHASSVATPRGAITFLGMTGSGKSTLAASFCQQGFPLLTDDCFLVNEKDGRFFAVPSYPGLRLWTDALSSLSLIKPDLAQVAHYTEKKRLVFDDGEFPLCADSVPLASIYVLDPLPESACAEPVHLTPLPASAALIEVVKCSYCLDVTDRARIREQFECLSRLVGSVPILRLRFPHEFSRLAAVRDTIVKSQKQE